MLESCTSRGGGLHCHTVSQATPFAERGRARLLRRVWLATLAGTSHTVSQATPFAERRRARLLRRVWLATLAGTSQTLWHQ